MKIAIQGHPTRGKEVIQILESLGGKKLYYFNADDKHLVFFIDDKGYISCLHYKNSILKEYYKIYTLEEFEEEFPFKIGDIVQTVPHGQPGIITELCSDPTYILVYKIRYNSKRELLFPSQILKLYISMKEERNITLTLDKAREWYNKGGELKEIALQAFTEKELNTLPKSWKEFIELTKFTFNGTLKCINGIEYWNNGCLPNKSIGESSKIWHKYLTLFKLEQLRDYYRQEWTPDWTNHRTHKHCIIMQSDVPTITVQATLNQFLSFQSFEVAEEFLKNFEPLIKEAGDLI